MKDRALVALFLLLLAAMVAGYARLFWLFFSAQQR